MSSTTLTGANISPATRVKTSRFTLRKHDYVGMAFGLIVATPALFALFSPTALRLWIASEGLVIGGLVGFYVITLPLAALCVWVTYPKGGAK